MPTVLIVCTGNLCRSPMVEGLLRARLMRDPMRHHWKVVSAGTQAGQGLTASVYAVEEMAERGIDLCGHSSRSVSEELVEEADLVLALTRHHAEALAAAFPRHARKVRLLSQMVGQQYDVCDPYGGTRLEYGHVARELEQLVESGYEHIVVLAEANAAESTSRPAS